MHNEFLKFLFAKIIAELQTTEPETTKKQPQTTTAKILSSTVFKKTSTTTTPTPTTDQKTTEEAKNLGEKIVSLTFIIMQHFRKPYNLTP